MRRILMGCVLLSLLWVGIHDHHHVQANGIRVVVVNELLNIRLTPAIGAPVIDTVEAGYAFDRITARSGDNQWVQVDYLCQEGWINLTPTVVLEGDINVLPIADPRSMPFGGFEAARAGFTTQTGSMIAKATSGLRIRSGPSTGYPTIGNINYNQQFGLLGRNRCASWVQVSFEGTLGWVSASYIQPISAGNVQNLPENGIVADSTIPQIDGAEEYFATLRLMLDRLNLAQPSLDTIRTQWTDAALIGRTICQEYPARPSDFNVPVPLLSANYEVLYPLQTDFNTVMAGVRNAIDLFIQVCNQPGTGNPVGQATVQGALNIINEVDPLFASLRDRLLGLIPDLTPDGNECLLLYGRQAELLPQLQFGTIYGDTITRRTYARGYCFSGLENQIINLQALPVPPAELKLFLAVSSIDNPTDFLAVNAGTPGVLQTVGPITLPRTGTYLIILADLQEDVASRTSFGEYVLLLNDLTFNAEFKVLAFDEASGSIVLNDRPESPTLGLAVPTQQATGVCPGINFACNALFNCEEAYTCLRAGNFLLDRDNNGVPCDEVGNFTLGAGACSAQP